MLVLIVGWPLDGSRLVLMFFEKTGLAVLGAGPPLELNNVSFWSHVVDGATCISESLFVFLFAAVGLDYCFKMRLLSPFPVKRQF